MDIKIAILQRGWVMVGEYSEVGDMIYLSNASVIRTWGTSEGLGQLALAGKQEGTVLDRIGRVGLYKPSLIALIDCDSTIWTSILKP